MPKVSKHMVDMANGGLFKKLVGDLFHYSDTQVDEIIERAARQTPDVPGSGSPRKRYLGDNPTITSPIGDQVWERYARQHPDRVRGSGHRRELLCSDGVWRGLSDIDMGHTPNAAVEYWNNYGRFLDRGPDNEVPTEIRDWMNNPDNYEPQWRHDNRSDGATQAAAGVRYQRPVNLQHLIDAGDLTRAQADQLLHQMRQRLTIP